LLRLGNLRVGWARLAELRAAVQRVRSSGKAVVVYFTSAPSDGEYYLASAADWIVCPPVSLINLDGLRAEATFYKGLMDKLGIEFEYERVGKYKSAVEQYSRKSLSEPAREVREVLLDNIFIELTEAIAKSRGLSLEQVRELIDTGPFASVEARDAGLVDQIAYEDELDNIVRDKIVRRARRVGLQELAKRKYHRDTWGPIPKVAVVCAAGTILPGVDRDDLIVGEVLGARTVAAAIREARNDREVKAIVLRINSPGGSGIASDIIRREVGRTRGIKPMVVSMSDVAASGGYYIACPADSIFASPTTITGSIGVYYGKVNLMGLYDKLGIDKDVATRGAHADMYSPHKLFDDDEREVLRRQMDMFYDNFINIAAEGRGVSPEQIDNIAQGRVWTGKSAKEIGLIDEFGGLPRAIAAAAQMAGIENKHYEIKILPRAKWFSVPPFKLPLWLVGYQTGDVLPDLSGLSGEHLWYMLPWRLEIR
jgi:protease-4